MLLYHATTEEAAANILQDGFWNDEATYMTVQMWRGVWLSDRPLEENEGIEGTALLTVNIPSELIKQYEWVQEGKPYREFLIPAELINRYHVRRSVLLSRNEKNL